MIETELEFEDRMRAREDSLDEAAERCSPRTKVYNYDSQQLTQIAEEEIARQNQEASLGLVVRDALARLEGLHRSGMLPASAGEVRFIIEPGGVRCSICRRIR